MRGDLAFLEGCTTSSEVTSICAIDSPTLNDLDWLIFRQKESDTMSHGFLVWRVLNYYSASVTFFTEVPQATDRLCLAIKK